jgi:hypothetical protein
LPSSASELASPQIADLTAKANVAAQPSAGEPDPANTSDLDRCIIAASAS